MVKIWKMYQGGTICKCSGHTCKQVERTDPGLFFNKKTNCGTYKVRTKYKTEGYVGASAVGEATGGSKAKAEPSRKMASHSDVGGLGDRGSDLTARQHPVTPQ
jgi:hypothetical protein